MQHASAIRTFAVVVAFTACSSTDRTTQSAADEPQRVAERGILNAMPSMDSAGELNRGGTVGASAAMMRAWVAHDRALRRLRGSKLMAALPEHRYLTANLVSQMQMDMRAAQISTARPWDALVDSVLHDLVRLPDESVSGVTAMMPAHRARVARLITMHALMLTPTPQARPTQ